MMDNYGTPPLALASGEGAVVCDADGNDATSTCSAGIAVNALGPRATRRSSRPSPRSWPRSGHVSNLFATEPAIALAERLVGQLGGAPDGPGVLLQLRRRGQRGRLQDRPAAPGRTKIVAAEGAFHGRTMGALALTGQPAKREPFEPLPGDVTHVPYGDVDALAAAVDDDTAAVFLEPIQGEAGVVVPPAGYLAAAREITAAHGALLVLDEVQTGIGRTGTWFAHQHDGVTPDVVTLAKGLGGGLPIGACLATGRGGRSAAPGSHGAPSAATRCAPPRRWRCSMPRGRRPARSRASAARQDAAAGHRVARPPTGGPRPRPRPAARHRAARRPAPGRRDRRPRAGPRRQRRRARRDPARPAARHHGRRTATPFRSTPPARTSLEATPSP